MERGWSAFVNSEDRSGLHPGTSLTGGPGSWRLSGSKTWIAASDHVDRLVVSAQQNEIPLAVIRRNQPGVLIESGEPETYLSELVQGHAMFDNVVVGDQHLFGDEHIFMVFRFAEPAGVRVALNAFMLSHTIRLGGPPRLIGGAVAGLFNTAAILRLQPTSRPAALGLLGIDDNTQWLASEFEAFVRTRDEPLYGLWMKDRRLVNGSSTGITTRAAAALGYSHS